MIRVLLVGTGGMGTVHYNNYAHVDDCAIFAVVGSTEADQQKAESWRVPFFTSITTALTEVDCQVVDICTPTFTHTDLVLEAIAAGRHVICEKPLALRADDARRMYQAARDAGVNIYVGQVLQFSKEMEVLRTVVQTQQFGEPLEAYFERLSACPRWVADSWLFDEKKSGLIPFDLHIHDLDMIVSLFGKPKGIQVIQSGRADISYTEHYRILYTYGGMNICTEAGWLHADIPFTARWRVYFADGMLMYDGEQVLGYPFDAEPIVYDTVDPVKIPTGINLPPTGWFLRELSHFIDCIRQNKSSPWVSEQQVCTVLETLNRIQ